MSQKSMSKGILFRGMFRLIDSQTQGLMNSSLLSPSFPRTFLLMSNDFYRRIQPQRAGRDFLRKALKNKKRTLLIILGCILILYVFFDNKGILARIRLESQRSEMIEKVKNAEEETKKLQAQAKALESDKKTLEKTAREKYGMVRQGETVYRVKKD